MATAPVGTFTTAGMAIGSIFLGPGSVIGTAIGGVLDALGALGLGIRTATPVLGWSQADKIASPIADKITNELSNKLNASQLNEMGLGLPQRAISFIMANEPRSDRRNKYIIPLQQVLNVHSTSKARIKFSIYLFLMQRLEWYATADVSTKLQGEIDNRLKYLIYDFVLETKIPIPVSPPVDDKIVTPTAPRQVGTDVAKYLPYLALVGVGYSILRRG